ncbi:MAG: protein kinase [Candidatus Eisenbacteria bacterium]
MVQKNISHYEVLEKIGAGGMGEVYRASDPKLGRQVAIKVLPEAYARDGERMARFQREAQLLASLNHPNIGAIYGLEEDKGAHALVLELIEGPTLADRIEASPFTPEQTIPIALQISEALENAHERGIIHRDLKPANIKLTPEGQVKVLDFGLAKALEDDREGSGSAMLSQSPTITGGMTGANVILGTAAYMSPEQARGSVVDRRADIWAFGVILYEMLAGRRLFSGETVSDTLASVLMKEADWNALPDSVPFRLRRLIRRCLERDPRRRLRDIGEARIVLEEMAAGVPDDAPAAAPPAATGIGRRTRLALAGALLFLAAGAGVVGWTLKSGETERPLRKYEIPLGDMDTNLSTGTTLALSPDGGLLAYLGDRSLWIRNLSELEPRKVDGSEGAQKPFWSPDGRWVGFGASGKLWKAPVSGGNAIMLCELPEPFSPAAGGAWRSDGRIVFCTGNGGLLEVGAQGGDPTVVLEPDKEVEDDFHNVCDLPGDRGLLFVVHRKEGYDTIDLLAGGVRRRVVQLPSQELSMPVYSPSGHILYHREPTNPGIWALPFSLSKLEPTGEPFLAVPEGALPSVGADGTLVYSRGTLRTKTQLVWVDRTGRELGTLGPAEDQTPFPSISPDGRRVAIPIRENENRDIWIFDTVRETKTRLTFDEESETRPQWDPTGRRIYYRWGDASDRYTIRMRTADGTGAPVDIANGGFFTVSPDGKYLLYSSRESGEWNLWYVPLGEDGLAAGDPVHFVDSKAIEYTPALSPDGRYVAYISDESGREEIYVKRFPEGDGKWQVSVNGGHWPQWNPDGTELYYVEKQTVMAVPVEATSSSIRLGSPEALFERAPSGIQLAFGWPDGFAVTEDGEKFIILKAAGGDERPRGSLGITVVQNWYSEFRPKSGSGS